MIKKLICCVACLLLLCGCKPAQDSTADAVLLDVAVDETMTSLVSEEHGIALYVDVFSCDSDIKIVPIVKGIEELGKDYQILAVISQDDYLFVSNRDNFYSGLLGYYNDGYDLVPLFDEIKPEIQLYHTMEAESFDKLLENFRNNITPTMFLKKETASWVMPMLEEEGQTLYVTGKFSEKYADASGYSIVPGYAIFVKKGIADQRTDDLIRLTSYIKTVDGVDFRMASESSTEILHYLELIGVSVSENIFIR